MSASEESLHTTATDLRMATFRLARRLRRERADDHISDAHFAVLANLKMNGALTIGALAQRERVTAPTMSSTVAALVEDGYVTRVQDEEDRRRVQVEITDAGTAVVTATVRKRDAALSGALSELDFTEVELQTLREASALMRKVAER